MMARQDDQIGERPRFNPGSIFATRGAMEMLRGEADGMETLRLSMIRHCSGDWGEVDAEDAAANDQALINGTRLLSAYYTAAGTKFWIITEADRSHTTVLRPEEY